jgi:hypothetical protein
MSQQPVPPFGTLNVVDEASHEAVNYDAGNVATNISDGALSEPVTYNAGNVATNISDGALAG